MFGIPDSFFWILIAALIVVIAVVIHVNTPSSNIVFEDDEPDEPVQGEPVIPPKLAREPSGTIEVYRDRAKKYRWRARALNGRIVATGHEGYDSHRDCMTGIEAVSTVFGGSLPEIKDRK